ncbi:MAG: ABC transporter ATP-binding protein [Verrucomicrobia bacterium]|nr:ABC transporter ATP-binding protein [Verrucomicrobiota bacterium]
MTEALVTIENVTKVFVKGEPPAIDGVSATVPRGQIVGLAGPDGAGKTTLIRLIAGLLLPTSGSVRAARPLGYMPQKFGLYEDLTVMQNLRLYAKLQGVLGEERERTFKKLLDFTDLAPFTERLAANLSGGMKQKLGLACALIKKPILLVLDEPTVGVDPISRRELWKMIKALLQEGISVLWSTSYLNEVEECDSALLINEGKLLYGGPPQELTRRVDGRIFSICNIVGNHRKLLFELLNQKNVLDGVIQGSDLRIVLRQGATPSFSLAGYQFDIKPQKARFEDAFMDILGGGPGGISQLADKRPIVVEKHETPVEAIDLTKKFKDFVATENITFKIKKGEIFGLLGPNGAGKSTTFRLLCGLLQPTSGKAQVNGLDLASIRGEARMEIGYMAQKFSLYPSLSVRQNLNFFAGIYNLKGAAKVGVIEEMIEVFDLKNYLSTTAGMLPLGFKQRLALACANMHRPAVLFLDEPTSGVDPITRREFWNHINGLVGKGVTVMVTTHFMDEAEYCDRIALIYRGKVIKMDTPDGLKDGVKTAERPNPTMEDAFVHLIEAYDRR